MALRIISSPRSLVTRLQSCTRILTAEGFTGLPIL